MAAKLALIFVVAVCLFHVSFSCQSFVYLNKIWHFFLQFFALQSEANIITLRERREAPAGNQKNDLEELLNSAKQSLDEFVSKIQVVECIFFLLFTERG